MTQWENILLGLQYDHGRLNHDAEDERDYRMKDFEIGLKHKDTGAVVKLSDDGLIDVFASADTGIRIDPNTSSVNLFGDSVNILANRLNVRTRPYGFQWNGKALNPDMYSEESEAMVEAHQKVRYSSGMLDIMRGLGLTVEEEDI